MASPWCVGCLVAKRSAGCRGTLIVRQADPGPVTQPFASLSRLLSEVPVFPVRYEALWLAARAAGVVVGLSVGVFGFALFMFGRELARDYDYGLNG